MGWAELGPDCAGPPTRGLHDPNSPLPPPQPSTLLTLCPRKMLPSSCGAQSMGTQESQTTGGRCWHWAQDAQAQPHCVHRAEGPTSPETGSTPPAPCGAATQPAATRPFPKPQPSVQPFLCGPGGALKLHAGPCPSLQRLGVSGGCEGESGSSRLGHKAPGLIPTASHAQVWSPEVQRETVMAKRREACGAESTGAPQNQLRGRGSRPRTNH